MSRAPWTAALGLAVCALASASATASVPSTLSFTARLVDDKSGAELTGAHQVTFALFPQDTGGTVAWQEERQVTVEEGLVFTDLGETEPLDATVFDGRKLWLEITLDGVVMQPRVALGSVPYAMRAGVADAVGELDAADVQARVAGTCATGNFIIGVNADGTVACAPDLSGSGDITSVLTGSGLQGGGNAGEVQLSLIQTCATDQILKWSGSQWLCAPDAGSNATGDITGVAVGPAGGLVGGGIAGDVALSLLNTCATGQVLKWSGTIWACGNDNDVDTNSGGDITDVVAGAGLTGGATAGAATVDVGAGQGISVAANSVALDTAFTDARYLNTAGDTLTGSLDAGGNRITNRGCPTGYVKVGQGMCIESLDVSGLTFSGCASRCVNNGAHMCRSSEHRATLVAGTVLGVTTVLDWIDDQDATGSALYVVTTSDAASPESARSTATASYCRCCTSLE